MSSIFGFDIFTDGFKVGFDKYKLLTEFIWYVPNLKAWFISKYISFNFNLSFRLSCHYFQNKVSVVIFVAPVNAFNFLHHL